MPPEKRVNPQVEERDEEVEGVVSTLADVGGGGPLPEVEVDKVFDTPPPPDGVPMVVIRVNEDVEEMSYVAGGRVERYTFETGMRYRVPIYIAAELEAIGKVWH